MALKTRSDIHSFPPHLFFVLAVMSAYDWVTRPRDYSSELKESILDIEDATEDHPLLEEDVEDGGDEVRGGVIHHK